jgi:hypothetical protein
MRFIATSMSFSAKGERTLCNDGVRKLEAALTDVRLRLISTAAVIG